MTETEFDVMDQLYFVVSFQDLRDSTEFDASLIKTTLWGFLSNGWVKCLINPEDEIEVSEEEFLRNFGNYYYLASKTGLLEHNLR